MASVHHVSLLFVFGGPDDRDGLAYPHPMVEHPGVCLTIVRFIPPDYKVPQVPTPNVHMCAITIVP